MKIRNRAQIVCHPFVTGTRHPSATVSGRQRHKRMALESRVRNDRCPVIVISARQRARDLRGPSWMARSCGPVRHRSRPGGDCGRGLPVNPARCTAAEAQATALATADPGRITRQGHRTGRIRWQRADLRVTGQSFIAPLACRSELSCPVADKLSQSQCV
jgi:hypothetical protein